MLRGLFDGVQYNSEAGAKCAVYSRARTKQGRGVIKEIRYVDMYVCMYVRFFLYVCMYVCMYVCLYVYMYIRMYVCLYVYMYVRMYVCMLVCMYACMCMYVCMYVCTYVCMYVDMYVCWYVCMYVCMYVCIHVYVCIIPLNAVSVYIRPLRHSVHTAPAPEGNNVIYRAGAKRVMYVCTNLRTSDLIYIPQTFQRWTTSKK